MKRMIVPALALALLASGAAFAQGGGFNGGVGGGFTGPSTGPSTVAKAKEMPDDHYVVLRGNIVEKTRKEHYLFRDETGSITIEIDDDDWRGLTVTPEDTVEIGGEVDKGWRSIKIDVDWVRKP